MRGHIRPRGKGKWAVVVELGRDPVTNKRKQKWVTVKGTKKEAEKVLAELVAAVENGIYVEPAKMTVGQYLDHWLEIIRKNLRENSILFYRRHIGYLKRTHIANIPLGKSTAMEVQKAINALPDHLCSHTHRESLRILRSAVKKAIEWELITKDPTKGVKGPRNEEKEVKVWTEKEAAAFLATATKSKYYGFFYIAMTTGMRIGELLALKWDDVNLRDGYVVVDENLVRVKGGAPKFGPTKTESSKRKIFIDRETADILRGLRAKQLEHKLKEGQNWRQHNLVFCKKDGSARTFVAYRAALDRLIKKAGVPSITIHTFRHTHATFLLNQGVHPQVIADRLGHSKKGTGLIAELAMTLRYSHVSDEARLTAVKAIVKALEKGRKEFSARDEANQTTA